jgi:hypothetical protein
VVINTLGGAGALERPDERLDVRSANRMVGPSLRLERDNVQAEPVLVDHAVQALVARAAKALCGVLAGAAVAHGQEHVQDDGLKEVRRLVEDSAEHLLGERCPQLPVGGIYGLLRRRLRLGQSASRSPGGDGVVLARLRNSWNSGNCASTVLSMWSGWRARTSRPRAVILVVPRWGRSKRPAWAR